MWILTPSITSAFAAATGALTSASNEQLAAAFARSLLSRSKPSPQRTWLQRLKRDSWTTHLSGAISSDSLGESFTDWWTSSLAATRASHSAQPASDSEPKTHDTSGRLSQPELLSCDQVPAFLKTSTDISRWGFPTFCKTWQDWVTERRGAWRARVSAARLTRGEGSSSWPTANARDWKDSITGTHPPSRPNMSEQTLGQAVSVVHGQAAPASSSTLGSRQGLWPTASVPNGGQTTSGRADKDTKKQVGLEHAVKQWSTPQAKDHKSGHRDPTIVQYKQLNVEVEAKATGKLNPRWVETLMGLPIGWTMPSCIRPVTIEPTSCDSLGTALCRPAQSERSDFLLASWPSPRAGESQQTDELSRLWVECGYKQPKTRGGKPRANNSTYDVTLETAVRGVAKAETNP